MNDLIAALQATGIEEQPVINGEIERYRSPGRKGKPGWTILHQVNDKVFGSFGNWGTGETVHWHNGGSRSDLNHRELEVMRIAARQRREEAKRMAARAVVEVNDLLNDSDEIDDHPYCLKKGIEGPVTATDNELIIPLHNDNGELTGAQRIDYDGRKLFVYGTKKKGSYHTLHGDNNTVYICEGWATGKTINKATGKMVLVAFDAGNLLPVYEKASKAYGKIVIAADNDHGKEKNTGIEAAESIKSKYGVDYVFPECAGSDFNDLYLEQGIDAVRKCFEDEEERTGFHFVDAETLLANIKPTDWLIKDVAVSESLSVLFGKPGTYKTFIAIHMLLCISQGIPFFGNKVRKGTTAIIIGEGQNNFAKRLLAWKRYHEINELNNFYISTVPAQLTVEQSAIEVGEAISKLPGDVLAVGIDTLNRNFGPGDENSSQDMTAFVNNLDHYVGRNIMRMIVHHSGHKEGRARGSSVLFGALDSEYEVKKDKGVISLHCTKMKDGMEFQPFHMKPESVNIGDKKDLLADTSIIMKQVDEDGDEWKSPRERLIGWVCTEKNPTVSYVKDNFELFGYKSAESVRVNLSKMKNNGKIAIDGEIISIPE